MFWPCVLADPREKYMQYFGCLFLAHEYKLATFEHDSSAATDGIAAAEAASDRLRYHRCTLSNYREVECLTKAVCAAAEDWMCDVPA